MFLQDLLQTLMHNLIHNPCSCEHPSNNCTELDNENREQLLLLMVGHLQRTEIVFDVDQRPGGVQELLSVRSVFILIIYRVKVGERILRSSSCCERRCNCSTRCLGNTHSRCFWECFKL